VVRALLASERASDKKDFLEMLKYGIRKKKCRREVDGDEKVAEVDKLEEKKTEFKKE
jgi:hypothetical protein